MELTNDSQLTIARLAPLIRKRKLSPLELTEFCLRRIERLQPVLNAYITVTPDEARRQARQAEREIGRGKYRGSLHGIPVCFKDLFYTKGVLTTGGSKILRRFVPERNAVAVDRLFEAGTIMLGKTNLHEFAYGVTNVNPHYGPVRNPWNPERISGGSSGGSAAAVAAGLAIASLGTDTGGSVRIPAAACGCVGLKPSYGLVPMDGVISLSASLDHAGPLCRCVEDAALVLGVLLRASFTSDLRKGIRGLRIGVPKRYFFRQIRGDVRRRVMAAIESMASAGALIDEVELKGMNETAYLASEITRDEALAFHWGWFRNRSGDYGEDVRDRLQESQTRTALSYLLAQKSREAYTQRLLHAMDGVDALAMPTIPVDAPCLVEKVVRFNRTTEDLRLALLRLTRPGNLTGLPAISLPCGFSDGGMPIGLQLMGRRRGEAVLLRIAYAYEQSTSWHERFPPELAA